MKKKSHKKRPKRNPTKKCYICSENIFNRSDNAMYCDQHSEDIIYIRRSMSTYVFNLRRQTGLSIKYTLIIGKK